MRVPAVASHGRGTAAARRHRTLVAAHDVHQPVGNVGVPARRRQVKRRLGKTKEPPLEAHIKPQTQRTLMNPAPRQGCRTFQSLN